MSEELKKLMSQVFSLPTASISDDFSTKTASEWDSLRHMMLVVAIEEQFNVSFTEQEIVELVSIKEIMRVLQQRMGTLAKHS